MEYGVLGPLEILGPAGRVELRGSRERLLLAHLLAADGRAVPVATLIDGLWAEDPPRTAGKALQNIVLRLRRALEPDRTGPPTVLVTDATGYRLVTEALHVDAHRFEALVRSAPGLPSARRAATLREALSLWRGEAYAGLTESPVVDAEARRLTELRASAIESWGEAELDGGARPDLVADLERLVVEHPLRERLWALLVRALYQQGRQGEALGAVARAREVLSAELGVDPGPELQALHHQVLAQDPRLSREARGAVVPPELASSAGGLVGRDQELAVLQDLWEEVRRGATVRVLLRAPAGAGALRLTAELAREVASTGAEVRFVGPSSAPEQRTQEPGQERGADPVLVVVARGAGPVVTGGRPALVVALAPAGTTASTGDVVLDLRPLEREEIRRVVAAVVPARLVDVVADQVWQESGGWPGRALRLASTAVRQRVTDEVRSAAARADSAAAALAQARSTMTTGVLDLGDPTERVAGDDSGERVGSAPWPGLQAYGPEEAEWFAGRERLVAEMLARLPGSGSLCVVGASGSGKSSAVGAGLLPALRQGRLPGSTAWRTLAMRPGARPLAELARTLLEAGRRDVGDLLEQLVRAPEGSADRWVLVVDQFEECWTECRDDPERVGFLDLLGGLATDPSSRTTLVVVVRADFLPRVAEHSTMAGALAGNTVLVGTPTADEVRRAVVAPAARAGLVLDDGLVDAIVADAGDEPGLLPLLSTTLRRIWEERDGRTLTLRSYVVGGGLRGAIGRLAEAEFTAMGPVERQGARTLFLRLAGSGEGDEVVRRRVRLDELEGLPGRLGPLLDLLADVRLVTVSGGYVEVAHEALFREWPRLRDWLGEDREGRTLQRRLALAAEEWRDESRDPAQLWTGARLEAAVDVAAARPDELTEVEHAFVRSGRELALAVERAAAREAAEKARQNRRLQMLLVGTVAVLAVALVAGVLALRARGREADAARTATRAAVAADAKRLAASALSLEQPDLALLTAVEATRLEQSAETYGAVLTLLGRHPDVVTRVSAGSSFMDVAADPGGRAVYLVQETPEVWAVEPRTGERLWAVAIEAMGTTVAVSPDGSRLAVLVVDRSGQVPDHVVVLGRAGEELWRITLEQLASWTGAAAVPYIWEHPAWQQDGTLAVATDTHVVEVAADGSSARSRPWRRAVQDTGTFVVWGDGRVSTGASGAGPGVVLDRSGAPRTLPADVSIGAVSVTAGRAAGTRDGATGTELVILDARTLRERAATPAVDGVVSFLRYSPDGATLAAGVDERIELRDGASGALASSLTGQSSDALGAAWGGTGHDLLWTAGREGTAVAFDLTGDEGAIAHTASPDHPWAGEGAAAADVEVWSTRDDFGPDVGLLRRSGDQRGVPLPLTGLEACRCEVTSTDVTADGRTALGGMRVLTPRGEEVADRGYVVAWDVATRRVRAVVDTPWPVLAVDAASDGGLAVVQGGSGWSTLDVASMRLGRQAELPAWSRFGWGTALAEVAPDGRRAVLLRGTDALVVSLDHGRVLAQATVDAERDGSLISAAWSADGEAVALGSSTGWLYVVDGSTLERVTPRRLLTGGPVADIEVSPDGRVAATLEGADGDVVLWDTSTWRPYGQAAVRDHGQGFLHFEPDSSHVEVVYGQGLRARVAAQPAAWVAAACAAANRGLTDDEVALLDTERPAGQACAVP